MSVVLLPKDIWIDIIPIITAEDLLSLILTGQKAFSLKLSAAAEVLNSKRRKFQKFPISLFDFPNVRAISVSMEEYNVGYPLTLQNDQYLPTLPVKTLSKLEIDFPQSFACFSKTSTPPVLSSLFPDLIHLQIRGLMEEIADSFWDTLPDGLQVLHLNLLPHQDRQLTYISISLISRLPRSLNTIYLDKMGLSATEAEVKAINWPPLLRHLTLLSMSSHCILRYLPSNLEHFHSENMAFTPLSVRVSTSSLPRSLKYLSIRQSDAKLINDGPLPPQLTYINCQPLKETAKEVFRFFPSSVTDFQQSLLVSPEYNLQMHFPNLKRFQWVGPVLTKPGFLETLPVGLVWLSIAQVDPDIVPWSSLPITLEELTVPLSNRVNFETFGAKNLKSLFTRSGSNNHSGPVGQLSLEQWRHFPLSITQLDVKAELFPTADCLKNLKNLKFLNIKYQPDLDQVTLASVCDNLPLSIETFVADLDGPIDLDWIPILSKRFEMANLRSLSCFRGKSEYKSNIESLPGYFATLPESLRLLTVHYIKNMPIDTFWHLPKCLHSLTISDSFSSKERPGSMTDEHFAHLPSNLSKFVMMGGATITADLLPLLPKNLLFLPKYPLSINPSFIEIGNQYFSDPKWQGIYKPISISPML